ncbi:hypothetical protein AVEN_98359-1, partial [Araneus ventricosus]
MASETFRSKIEEWVSGISQRTMAVSSQKRGLKLFSSGLHTPGNVED